MDCCIDGWMYGWLDVCVDGVLSVWRGLISRKLVLSVVLCCHCFVVGWVGVWVG